MLSVGLLVSKAVTARANIERVLRHIGMLEHVTVLSESQDRVRARYAAEFLAYVIEHFDRDPGKPTLHPGAWASYREPGAVMPALQVCFREDATADIDLDLAAPFGGDVASLVTHGTEVLWHWLSGRKSNQRRIARWLDRRFHDV